MKFKSLHFIENLFKLNISIHLFLFDFLAPPASSYRIAVPESEPAKSDAVPLAENGINSSYTETLKGNETIFKV